MAGRKGAKQIAPMIRGAFIRAAKSLEASGKPLSTIIQKQLEEKPLETLKAIASFVPKELLIEVDLSEELANMTEDSLNASIERLIGKRTTISNDERTGTPVKH